MFGLVHVWQSSSSEIHAEFELYRMK
uniref:Uncharacterized protein n=1 Tax=Arundo donax TaxID=35708 RepID=A0A0A9HKI7_ARUDO